MMELICDCCGFAQKFEDGEEAFKAGWDAPPHFTGYIACSLCPAAFIMLGHKEKHIPVHERWEREGRPDEFSQETCLSPEDHVPNDQIEQVMDWVANMSPEDRATIERIRGEPFDLPLPPT